MPQRPTQREFLVAESSVEVRVWQDQRMLDLVPPLASGDQLRHLGSSYQTQYKQESAICEMGFKPILRSSNSGKPMSALGQKRTADGLAFEFELFDLPYSALDPRLGHPRLDGV
jgi:hypothetical protein